jgi:hypothetical protein
MTDRGQQLQQSIINLYNSGILPDIIAIQLDTGKDEVYQVIQNQVVEEQRKQMAVKRVSNASALDMFSLDTVTKLNWDCNHTNRAGSYFCGL